MVRLAHQSGAGRAVASAFSQRTRPAPGLRQATSRDAAAATVGVQQIVDLRQPRFFRGRISHGTNPEADACKQCSLSVEPEALNYRPTI